MWGIVRWTLTQTGIIGRCLIRKGSGIAMTQERLIQEECRSLIFCVQDFLARHFQQQESGRGLQIPEGRCSLRLPEWLRPGTLHFFCLKMYPDCFRMTKAGRFVPSSIRFQNWGTMWNGRCLTARISESPSQEGGCILSDILMKDVPEKYYLSREQTERLLYKSLKVPRGKGSTTRTE